MRARLTVAIAAVASLAIAVPAAAVTNGAPDTDDGDTYDAVGNLLFYVPDAIDSRFDDPGSWFTCTGTLIEDDVVVTAGHCTYGVGVDGESPTEVDGATLLDGGTDVWITFEADATEAFDVLPAGSSTYAPDRNDERYRDWSAALDASDLWYEAVAHTHPEYDDALFYLRDLGVLTLTEPVPTDDVAASEYGTLPEVGYLDQFQTQARTDQRHTVVGYGIQEIVPDFQSDDVRYEATVRLLTTRGQTGAEKGVSVVFSNNKGKAVTGGTCFGDSGGPVFAGDEVEDDGGVIIAVTSYGLSPNCTGIGGGYRIDKAVDLAFIGSFTDGS